MNESDIRLTPIKNGTSIDHLKPFTALKVLDILGHNYTNATTIAVNIESERMGKKDLIFLDKTLLEEKEIVNIGLVAHNSTLNEIKDSVVVKKQVISIPKKIKRILTCQNTNCITNQEDFSTKFDIFTNPFAAKCFYCEKKMNNQEILKNIGVKK